MWALIQRIVPGAAQDSGMRAPPPLQKEEEMRLGMNDRSIPGFLRAEASSLTLVAQEDDVGAASLHPLTPTESARRAAGMDASLDILAEQMFSPVEVVSAQETDIKALKMRCQQLEEHDQAIMVAFTTFFHVLAAKRVAKLEDIAAILHNIIQVAQREAYPQESVRFLEGLATMLHEQSGSGTTEAQMQDGSQSVSKD
jgi:hypothetical protein